MVYALYAVTAMLLLCSVKRKPNTPDTPIFTRNDTLCLKGFAAVYVIFHHLGQYFSIPDPIHFNGYMGGVSVGIFFMLSAYGLTKGREKKGYYKRIFLQKIPVLYLYQVLMNTLYYCLFFTDDYQTLGEVLPRILNVDFLCGLSRLNGFSWFIPTILIIYACFGGLLFLWEKIGAKCKNERFWFSISVSAAVVILYVLVLATPIDTLYSRSIFCFALGVWVAVFEQDILAFLRTRTYYILSCIGAGALTVGCFFLFPEQVICVATCVFIVIFFARFSYPRAPVFEFLGRISLEIYLVQKIFFLCMPFENEWRDGAMVFALVLLAAFILNLLVGAVKRLLGKAKMPSNISG